MRYAIVSDIHSNLEAFNIVLFELEGESPDQVLCLGDIVGYGPDPNECITKIRETANIVIVGNHDHAAIGLTDISYFNPYARDAIEWTMGELSEKEKGYLKQLPFNTEITKDDLFLVHSTPKRPQNWNYIFTVEDAIENFRYFTQRICFIGHSHVPVIIKMDNSGGIEIISEEAIIDEEHRYIINVGSVGQPRDGNADAAYAIFDKERSTVKIKRVSYNYKKTQEKMKKAGISDYLIDRIALGR
ncbi:MAG: metallophosphoesterase family protein [Nitrospirota bacterium]